MTSDLEDGFELWTHVQRAVRDFDHCDRHCGSRCYTHPQHQDAEDKTKENPVIENEGRGKSMLLLQIISRFPAMGKKTLSALMSLHLVPNAIHSEF